MNRSHKGHNQVESDGPLVMRFALTGRDIASTIISADRRANFALLVLLFMMVILILVTKYIYYLFITLVIKIQVINLIAFLIFIVIQTHKLSSDLAGVFIQSSVIYNQVGTLFKWH